MIVLASRSPRRASLLRSALVPFEVIAPDIDERFYDGESPRDAALRIAVAKARAVDAPGRIVIAADTVVALDERPLGKPESERHCVEMLASLAGRTHAVTTAVAGCQDGDERALTVTTKVRFRALSRAEIRAYVATGEPFDKAGGYGIQGEGGALVDVIEGSYTNVVGLPLSETLALIEALSQGHA